MVGEIAPEELEGLLEAGASVRIVDIRSRAAYESGHIPGSENVPFDRLTAEIDRFGDASHIVTVCPHGEASVQAARLIESFEGVPKSTPVESLEGGIDAWNGELATEERVT